MLEVVHERISPSLHLDEVEVHLQLETRGEPHAEQVLARLRERGYRVYRVRPRLGQPKPASTRMPDRSGSTVRRGPRVRSAGVGHRVDDLDLSSLPLGRVYVDGVALGRR